MSDFASATMMRIIAAGLADQGINGPTLPSTDGPRVALPAKRRFLELVLNAHWPLAILRIGAAVRDMGAEPAQAAIALARTPEDLLDRWQRLERYVHSRHFSKVQHSGDTYSVTHLSRTDTPPHRAEDLLIYGVLVALADRLPGWNAHASLSGGQITYRRGRWDGAGDSPAKAGTLQLTVSAQKAPDPPPQARGDTLHLAQRLLRADPCRAWSLAELAGALHMSPRSLQRALARKNARFSALLIRTRTTLGAEMLTGSLWSAAEIGYACGFADQAHFARSFKRVTAMTPRRFRQEFSPRIPPPDHPPN